MPRNPAATSWFRWALALRRALACAVILALATPLAPAKEPAVAKPPGPREHKLKGLTVTLDPPVLVGRRRGYLWFPTITRRSDGVLMALMSNYADIAVHQSTALAATSVDGGKSWGELRPALYGDVSVETGPGDVALLPYYMYPRAAGGMSGPGQRWKGEGHGKFQDLARPVVVDGWPRADRSFDAKLGLSGFVFNGQVVSLKEGPGKQPGYLATLYGYFGDEKRYSLVAAESTDAENWKIRSVIAGADCPLEGGEGPCEAALCRLADGRLMCVYRLASFVKFGQQYSSDDGRSWTKPAEMAGPFSVQPSLALLESGPLLLSGGRRGVFLWLDKSGQGAPAGSGAAWEAVDLVAHHNHFRPDEPIDPARDQTTAYTEVVAVGKEEAIVIYDRVPRGWHAIPEDSQETNSVWITRCKITASK